MAQNDGTDVNVIGPFGEKSPRSGFSEFYLGVLYGSAYNFFTPRNKFKISWSDSNTNYNSPYGPAQQYKTLSAQILHVFQNFRMYVDHIDLPGLTIAGGEVINDGKGPYYVQGDQMLSPESNEIVVWFRETMISIADLANIWINFNATPWVRPLKLNLAIDYYSDFDGTTSVMAYMLDGCRPIELDMINARHDGKEVLLRGIKMGFNNITPIECNGGARGTSAVMKNWSALLQQIERNQAAAKKNDNTIFDELGKSWDESKGFFGTAGGIASTLITGQSVALNSVKEEQAVSDFASTYTGYNFVKSLFVSDKTQENDNALLSDSKNKSYYTNLTDDDDHSTDTAIENKSVESFSSRTNNNIKPESDDYSHEESVHNEYSTNENDNVSFSSAMSSLDHSRKREEKLVEINPQLSGNAIPVMTKVHGENRLFMNEDKTYGTYEFTHQEDVSFDLGNILVDTKPINKDETVVTVFDKNTNEVIDKMTLKGSAGAEVHAIPANQSETGIAHTILRLVGTDQSGKTVDISTTAYNVYNETGGIIPQDYRGSDSSVNRLAEYEYIASNREEIRNEETTNQETTNQEGLRQFNSQESNNSGLWNDIKRSVSESWSGAVNTWNSRQPKTSILDDIKGSATKNYNSKVTRL